MQQIRENPTIGTDTPVRWEKSLQRIGRQNSGEKSLPVERGCDISGLRAFQTESECNAGINTTLKKSHQNRLKNWGPVRGSSVLLDRILSFVLHKRYLVQLHDVLISSDIPGKSLFRNAEVIHQDFGIHPLVN